MTDRYAVIGNPVAHTKSPLLQTAFARQCGQDMSYEMILGPVDAFNDTVCKFRDEGGKGMNITLPFKIEAFQLADELTPRSRAAGAVNTFLFRDDGTILGDNTDGFGIVRDITHNLGRSFTGKRVLLLGAGGAVRGALLPILIEKPAEIFIANRTASKAIDLMQQFNEYSGQTRMKSGGFTEALGCFDIIINGTTSSLMNEVPPLASEVWGNKSLAYDMYYQKDPTHFVLAALAAGVELATDGLGMVVEQGAESFYLWRGLRPDTAPVLAALR